MSWNALLWIVVLSALPVSELRGGIPFGIAQGVSPGIVFVLAVLANCAIVPLVFFFLEWFHEHLLNWSLYARHAEKQFARARGKVAPFVHKYGVLGLVVFVAIPFPLTGAYTGTIAAWVSGLKFRETMGAVSLGVLIAGGIVLIASLTGASVLGWVL